MHARAHGVFLTLLFAGLVSVSTVGCYHHQHDYDEHGEVAMQWSAGEEPYYERWENQTHRDHKDWNQRSSDEQRQYWSWRHDHQS